MSNFTKYNANFTKISLTEGYRQYRENGGKIYELSGSYETIGKITPGPHWSGVWTRTFGTGNNGWLFIKPVSKEARRLVRIHQVEAWANQYGLKEKEARVLYHAKIPWKHEILPLVAEAIRDKAAVRAFRSFPGVGPSKHKPWLQRWQPVVEHYLPFSWPRREALIRAVNLLTA